MRSPFFYTPVNAAADSLAILHLKRDNLQPVQLQASADDGYAEGAVTNTRFGSYPHSTLIGIPWGSQVRASKVDTGTRGRKGKYAEGSVTPTTGQKRKREESQQQSGKKSKGSISDSKQAVEAGSGFTHILQPTPETWTSSLDHRTQVVYVPDYSYILSRLAVKPGDAIIEAGAGSGSFTHAAARAVFNGYSSDESQGKVFSFEYHEPRVQTLRQELQEHALDSIVHLSHRDVCGEGFYVAGFETNKANAIAVFLDLPAPWLALKHLTRSTNASPLSAHAPIRICSFSPCIEQVNLMVAALRTAGWTHITMVEVANRRIDVRRDRVGLKEEGLRGVNAVAATVEESIERLREVESKLQQFQDSKDSANGEVKIESKAKRLEVNKKAAEQRKLYQEGNLIHRTEPEVKTHTSYLVFAILPREWSAEDEDACDKLYTSK